MNVHSNQNFEKYRSSLLTYLNATKEQRSKIDYCLSNKLEIPQELMSEIRNDFKKKQLNMQDYETTRN